MNALFDILTVRMDYDHKVLVIIDQTQLPGKEVYLEFGLLRKYGKLFIY